MMRINRLLICCAIFIFGHTLNAHAQKIIQTVAGSGSTTFGGLSGDGGPAVLSRLSQNYMMTLDASGNLHGPFSHVLVAAPAAQASALARPMPCAAAVMSTVLPCKRP